MFAASKLRLTLLDAPRELVEDFASSLRPMFPRKVMSYGANEDGVHVIEVKREGLRCELLRLHLRFVHGTDGSRSARVRAEPLPRVHAALLRERGLQARREHTSRTQGPDVLGPAQGVVGLPQYADAQAGEQTEAIVRGYTGGAYTMTYHPAACTVSSLRRTAQMGSGYTCIDTAWNTMINRQGFVHDPSFRRIVQGE